MMGSPSNFVLFLAQEVPAIPYFSYLMCQHSLGGPQITISCTVWILLALVENSRRHNGAMGSDFPVSSDIPIVCGRDLTQSLVSASSLEGASHRRPFLSGVVTAHETGCASESVSVDFD